MAEGGITDGICAKVEVEELDVAEVVVEGVVVEDVAVVVAVETVIVWVVVVLIIEDIVDKDVNVVIWVDDAEVATAMVSITVRVIGGEKSSSGSESPSPASDATPSPGSNDGVVWRLCTKSRSARRRRRRYLSCMIN